MQLSFDDYLTDRVKLGKYQYYEFIILSMIEFMSGFQEIFVGILVRILKTEWNISDTQQMILGSTFYGGVMIGNSVCSALADWAGRRVLLLISQACTVLTIIINSFAQTYTEIVIALFLYGLLFGVAMPISQVMISEIVPVKTRGRFIVLLQLIYIFGILYLTLCCFIFLDSFDNGDWRSLLRFNTIPAILCLIGSIFWLRESPRLYIGRGDFEKGFSELNFMGKMNDQFYENITIQEQNQMIEWQKITLQQQFEDVSPIGLIKPPNLRISITIWAIFMSFNIISTGIQMITPYIYADNDAGFEAAFIAYSSEIVAILVVVGLIDIPKWGGRINVTIYGLLLLAFIQISIWYWQQAFVVWGLVFQRFSIRVVWSCLNAMPAESYSTAYRSKGVGAAQGLGKLSGMISPFPMLIIYDQSHFLPFLVCAGMSLLTLSLVFIYPINATQKQLDQQNNATVIPDEAEDFKTMSNKSNKLCVDIQYGSFEEIQNKET